MTEALRDVFSSSYAQAREKFLHAAEQAGLPIESKVHPLRGSEGEELAMDVALDGDPRAQAMLVVTSACHGVEGFCGSGIQVAALRDAAWRERVRSRGVALLYVHALNPHGFSYLRRVTQENVDLNRNFHDFSRPLPVNEDYRELHPLLLPGQWPPSTENRKAIEQIVAERGEAVYQASVSRGQQEFADGLFFGGTGPTWSNTAWREVLRAYCQAATRLAWIDIHTGLGPSGVGERIFAGRNDDTAVQRARRWWDAPGGKPVTSIYDGSSSSPMLTGMMTNSIYEECPAAQYTGIALEFGTEPIRETLDALRGDHWLHQHPEAAPDMAQQIRHRMLRAYFTDTDAWKEQVLAQARQALNQAADGLASG